MAHQPTCATACTRGHTLQKGAQLVCQACVPTSPFEGCAILWVVVQSGEERPAQQQAIAAAEAAAAITPQLSILKARMSLHCNRLELASITCVLCDSSTSTPLLLSIKTWLHF
jgi:hypothetical protein